MNPLRGPEQGSGREKSGVSHEEARSGPRSGLTPIPRPAPTAGADGRDQAVDPAPMPDRELAELRLYRTQVAENISATPHLDHENARNTLACTDRAIRMLEARL